MPELPEVETVCRGLEKAVKGWVFDDVILRRPTLRFPIPSNLPGRVKGNLLENVTRHAKYALIKTPAVMLLLHLGMSGRISFSDDIDYIPQKHDHVLFKMTKQGQCKWVIFNDARRFGMLDLIPKGQQHRLLEKMGIDPLSGDLTPEWLYQRTRSRQTTMKAFLMDQRHIAGLGNIYVSEALFRAGVLPTRVATSLTKDEAQKLVRAIQDVLSEAITAGGSSLKDYVQTDGTLGYFQSQFRVYGRASKPCMVCENPIEKIVQSNRASFYCANCQK